MKVLLLNGSIHKDGTTATALQKIAETLEQSGIETEVYQIGAKPISDCMACGQCAKLGKCVVEDGLNEFVAKAREADGFVFGTPVYFAHPSGSPFRNSCVSVSPCSVRTYPSKPCVKWYVLPSISTVSPLPRR